MKRCRKCGDEKPLSDFSPDKKNLDGKKGWCKACMREQIKMIRLKNPEKYSIEYSRRANLKSRLKGYGLTLEDYDHLSKDGCHICGGQEKLNFALDHCHKSGKFRGLLCRWCNNGLGHFKDDPKLLERAIAYLRT
jgi:hypothetical protein